MPGRTAGKGIPSRSRRPARWMRNGEGAWAGWRQSCPGFGMSADAAGLLYRNGRRRGSTVYGCIRHSAGETTGPTAFPAGSGHGDMVPAGLGSGERQLADRVGGGSRMRRSTETVLNSSPRYGYDSTPSERTAGGQKQWVGCSNTTSKPAKKMGQLKREVGFPAGTTRGVVFWWCSLQRRTAK